MIIQGTIKAYMLGLLLCIVLTLAAYFSVTSQIFTGHTLLAVIVGLAIVQALVQLVLFLHLGQEDHPKWKLMSFLFMTMVIIIVVFGSLWIMFNLDERVMPSMHMHEGI